MPDREITARVRENKPLNSIYHVLRLEFRADDFFCDPGQFLMLEVSANHDPLLRRPFSIWDWTQKNRRNEIVVLYKVVGQGTERMRAFQPSMTVHFTAPLGRGFAPNTKRKTKLLISGGVGLPPMDFLLRQCFLKEPHTVTHLFHGERSNEHHPVLSWEGETARMSIHRATEDGTRGFSGNVMELFEDWFRQQDSNLKGDCELFACGPNVMLKKVLEFTARERIRGQISVENHMGCGRGVCLGCVLPKQDPADSKDQWYRVCMEGPVFEAGEVVLP